LRQEPVEGFVPIPTHFLPLCWKFEFLALEHPFPMIRIKVGVNRKNDALGEINIEKVYVETCLDETSDDSDWVN
jgi:hypothetical protein